LIFVAQTYEIFVHETRTGGGAAGPTQAKAALPPVRKKADKRISVCPIFPLHNKENPASANEDKNGLTGVEKQAGSRNENQAKITIMLIIRFLSY
jgi:hypothetical protein